MFTSSTVRQWNHEDTEAPRLKENVKVHGFDF